MFVRLKSTLTSSYPVLQLAKAVTSKHPKILMYHSFSDQEKVGYVSKDSFEWQLQQLKKGFHTMPLIELANAINAGKKIPKNTVVLTIDDGYLNVYEHAYPLLKKYGIPATFFVTTNFIDQKDWLWPDKIKWLLQKNNERKLLSTINYNNVEYKFDFENINALCLSIENDKKLDLIQEIAEKLDLVIPINATDEFASCTWEQLNEMQANGIEIGSHTVSHPSLGQVGVEHARFEISESLAIINRKLGRKTRTFCYPNGQPNDYNDYVKTIVKESSYAASVTAFHDRHRMNKAFAWRRFDGSGNKIHFLKVICGVEMVEHRILNKVRSDY